MESLKEHFRKLGCNPEIEKGHNIYNKKANNKYLEVLSCYAALDINKHLTGRETNGKYVKELSSSISHLPALKKQKTTIWIVPYFPLWRAIQKTTGKEINYIPEFLLEVKVTTDELNKFKSCTKEKQEKLREICLNTSMECLNERKLFQTKH